MEFKWYLRKILFWFRVIVGTSSVKDIYMAQKLNSSTIDSCWFKYKNISPGGYAVDYYFFYTLYRILSSVKPSNILEFGLGQTSKMVHQYANYYNKRAVSVEHDEEWISFFNEGKDGDYFINIKLFDLQTIYYRGAETSIYKNCVEYFQSRNEKFDFVLVDGPLRRSPRTNKEYKYVRSQIIDIVKTCVDQDFIILLDDYNYKGVRNTVNVIFSFFEENNIKFIYREYMGSKSHMLITTPKYKFLTTL